VRPPQPRWSAVAHARFGHPALNEPVTAAQESERTHEGANQNRHQRAPGRSVSAALPVPVSRPQVAAAPRGPRSACGAATLPPAKRVARAACRAVRGGVSRKEPGAPTSLDSPAGASLTVVALCRLWQREQQCRARSPVDRWSHVRDWPTRAVRAGGGLREIRVGSSATRGAGQAAGTMSWGGVATQGRPAKDRGGRGGGGHVLREAV